MGRLFRDIDGDVISPQGSVVCIGAFDGLHSGHRALVRHTVARARELGVPAVALTFEPLPREFFARDEQHARLMLPAAKAKALWAEGIDVVGLLRFNEAMTKMTPREFSERILFNRLHAKEVWVGPGFAYGNKRAGNLQTLRDEGAEFGFSANEIETHLVDGARVSSTAIRNALSEGDFAYAAKGLGRPYTIQSRVVHGAKLGRTLGFPTANLRFGHYRPVLHGIYACWATLANGERLPAVASFGTRPTVNGKEPLLEVHLFDFDEEIYGEVPSVEFVAKIRDEEKFDSLEDLTAQMVKDASDARAILYEQQPQRASA